MLSMRSTAPMRIAKTGYIIISAAMCLLGGIMIAVPDFSIKMFGIICGIMLILFGIVKFVGFFSKDLYRLAFQYDLSFGSITIALGILMLVNPGNLMHFICITLGLSILTDSIFKIHTALESKKFGISKWWLVFVCSIAAGIFGLILMFRPGESSRVLTVVLGVSLVLEGLLNFSTVLTAVKIIRHQRPDVIEVDFDEEGEV